jgi:hypothetical protein
MPFSSPERAALSYLILRQLYDGDVIDWPVGDEHALADVFAALASQGYLARWRRVWPLRDRYRPTEKGIAAIEAVYRPAEAEGIWQGLGAERPAGRRALLRARGHEPRLWPVLHDPHTHWSSWPQFRGPWYEFVWEDEVERAPAGPARAADGGDDGGGADDEGTVDEGSLGPEPWPRADVVDLDADAGRVDFAEGDRAEYDVS